MAIIHVNRHKQNENSQIIASLLIYSYGKVIQPICIQGSDTQICMLSHVHIFFLEEKIPNVYQAGSSQPERHKELLLKEIPGAGSRSRATLGLEPCHVDIMLEQQGGTKDTSQAFYFLEINSELEN